MTLAVLALCALLQGGDGLLDAPRARARWVEAPTAVELGVPFELVLEVAHEVGEGPRIEPGELASDPAWAVLAGGTPLALPDLDDPRRRVSEVRWSVVVLEPGARALPAIEVSQDGQRLEIEGARELEVAGVLAPGEDAPRPMPPDLGIQEGGVARASGVLVLLGIGAAVLIAVGALLLRRRARAVQAAAPRAPTPLERLVALEETPLDEPRAVREAHLELTRALRQHLDGATARDALTDEEWLAARALAPDGELARLLAECRPVEYGGELPTHWATRERVARARALAEQGVGA